MLGAGLVPLSALGPAAAGTTERVNVGPGGAQANGRSSQPAVSADGRFVAFVSEATNLAPGEDANGSDDVFVRDRLTGRTERVSVATGGAGANGEFGFSGSLGPAISADGRFVAFYSRATNLVPGDTNRREDVFVRDRRAGTTERVSLGPRGAQADAGSYTPAISADGRLVAFASDASNLVLGDTSGATDVFVHDRLTGRTQRVSVGQGGVQANAGSGGPALAPGGRFVAFGSAVGNQVPGDTNGVSDAFAHDRWTGRVERVSVGAGGAQGNDGSGAIAISAGGRVVAFGSAASNLVPGDTNREPDTFVRDRRAGTTRRANVGPGGAQANGRGDGLVSYDGALSPDGRFVAFVSDATNLVEGGPRGGASRRMFLRDRRTGLNEQVSVGAGGAGANGYGSFAPSISAGGRFVAFTSDATNLVPGDTNGREDIFVRAR